MRVQDARQNLAAVLKTLPALMIFGLSFACQSDTSDAFLQSGDGSAVLTPTQPVESGEVSLTPTVTEPSPTRVPKPTWTPSPSPTPRALDDVLGFPCGPDIWHWPLYANGVESFIDWTSDSSFVVFDLGESLWKAGVDSPSVTRLVDLQPAPPWPNEEDLWPHFGRGNYDAPYGFFADLSPDDSMVLYTTCEFTDRNLGISPANFGGRNYDIASLKIGENDMAVLTDTGEIDLFPSWSPDGTQFAFVRLGHRGHLPASLVFMNSEGSHYFLIGSVGYYFPPTWSPDGMHIIYSDYSPDEPEGIFNVVALQDVDRRFARLQQIETPPLGQTSVTPTWSPDSARIAFALSEPVTGVSTISVTTLDGSDTRVIFQGLTRGPVTTLDWSPDGSEILVVSGDIWTISPDGSVIRNPEPSPSLVPPVPPRWIHSAAWSPDGAHIAMRGPGLIEHDTYNFPEVFIMARDGTDARAIAGVDVSANIRDAIIPCDQSNDPCKTS